MMIDRNLRQTVRAFVAANTNLALEGGRRHVRVVNTTTGDFVPVAASSGDRRAARALTSQLRRLADSGRGLIAAKSVAHGYAAA